MVQPRGGKFARLEQNMHRIFNNEIYVLALIHMLLLVLLLFLLLLLKEVGNSSLRESDLHPMGPMTPTPQYQPRQKEEKGKGGIVEDKKG